MTNRRNDEGQMTIDFLFGLAVFLFAFLYLVTMVPGLFMPYQNNAVDLSSVVYRTSTLLVEDPGYFSDSASMAHGTQWETMTDINDVQRVGLAESRSTPDIISKAKLAALKKMPYDESRARLGLKNSRQYDYYLTLTWINNTTSQKAITTDVINGITPNSQNVETIQRSVLIDEGKRLLADANDAGDTNEIGVNVTRADITDGNTINNVTLTIVNSQNGQIGQPRLYTGPNQWFLNYGQDQDYAVYINHSYSTTAPPIAVQAGSQVDISINGSTLLSRFLTNDTTVGTLVFNTGSMYIFNDTMSTPPRPYNVTHPLYCSIYDKANMNLKVWS